MASIQYPHNHVEVLTWSKNELQRVRHCLAQGNYAPKTLARLRSTLKSLDGAIRHAERMRAKHARVGKVA